jgi:hypothetical protein
VQKSSFAKRAPPLNEESCTKEFAFMIPNWIAVLTFKIKLPSKKTPRAASSNIQAPEPTPAAEEQEAEPKQAPDS